MAIRWRTRTTNFADEFGVRRFRGAPERQCEIFQHPAVAPSVSYCGFLLLVGMEHEFLHAPIQQFGDVEHVL